jgi:hypothetical protein
MAAKNFRELTAKMSPEVRARVDAEGGETLARIERYGEHFEYLGFIGSIEDSPEDGRLHGKLLGIRDLVAYDGTAIDELEKNFHGAVDEYLAFCKAEGKAVQKSR